MKKILLIEDTGSVRDVVRKELRKKGYEVGNAYDCTSAIGLWKAEGPFDCIILDLNIDSGGFSLEEINDYFPIHGILVLNKIYIEEIIKQKKKECKEIITKELEKTFREVAEKEFKNGTYKKLEMEILRKTVIYSGYIDDFLRKEKEFHKFEKSKLIYKGKMTSIFDLIEQVDRILNR